jgi:hypothetical protein
VAAVSRQITAGLEPSAMVAPDHQKKRRRK